MLGAPEGKRKLCNATDDATILALIKSYIVRVFPVTFPRKLAPIFDALGVSRFFIV